MDIKRYGTFFPGGIGDKARLSHHPFSGLPSHITEQIGEDGLGGLIYFFDHFFSFNGPVAEGAAGPWLLSGATGTATVVLSNVRFGEIVLTADATGSANPTLQLGGSAGAPLLYLLGKRMWVFARLKIATVASTEFFFGIGTPDTQPTTTGTFPSDGIFFQKASSATKLAFDARKDGTSTSKAAITGTLVDATYTIIGFQVDILGNIIPYQDGSVLPLGVIPVGTANIPSGTADVMQFMIGFLGASQAVSLDWVLAAQEI